jgi:fused signal recognition particle receptor
VERLKERAQWKASSGWSGRKTPLSEELTALLAEPLPSKLDEPRMLTVVLVVGVNGSGKTTSIAKLAQYYRRRGRRVVLAAGDTFRAAAVDQLKIWGDRVGISVIAQAPGADPGAVVYDAIRASQESRNADILIIDTAGRLHTKFNLMKELQKVHDVAARQVHDAPHETLLVVDATTGRTRLRAKLSGCRPVTGIILTKLDSTAKGASSLPFRRSWVYGSDSSARVRSWTILRSSIRGFRRGDLA